MFGKVAAMARGASRLLSRLAHSDRGCGGNAHGPPRFEDLARTGRRLHCRYGVLPQEVDRCWTAIRKGLPEAALLKRRSWNEAGNRKLRSFYGAARPGKRHPNAFESLEDLTPHSIMDLWRGPNEGRRCAPCR